MAYPNAISSSTINMISDVSEYFKSALLDTSFNPERWPVLINTDSSTQFFVSVAPSLPMTRGQFYTWINNHTGTPSGGAEGLYFFRLMGGNALYTFSEANNAWPTPAINDWAKIKLLEYMLFGSFGNGGSTSDTSDVGSGSFTSVLPGIQRWDHALLRHALVRFSDYGSCHGDVSRLPAPTSFSFNSSTREFNFTYASGYTSLSQYRYSSPATEGWVPFTSKPQPINYTYPIPAGGVEIKLLSTTGYEQDSDPLSNPSEIPGVPFVVTLSAWIDINELVIDISVTELTNTNMSFSITPSINGSPSTPVLAELLGNTYFNQYREFAPGASSAGIVDAEVDPEYTVEGAVIQLNY